LEHSLFPSQEASEWLRLAARDIRLAELAPGDAPPLAGEALYHAQQAAEKALKGFLVHNGVVYPLTHDVRKLLEICEATDRDMAVGLIPAAGLTQFAIRFRYPGEDQPTREEAIPWLNLARLVWREVTRRLPADPLTGSATGK
jgi:HEPN domain-containing protein